MYSMGFPKHMIESCASLLYGIGMTQKREIVELVCQQHAIQMTDSPTFKNSNFIKRCNFKMRRSNNNVRKDQ